MPGRAAAWPTGRGRFGTSGSDAPSAVAVDSTGNVVVAARFKSAVDLGGTQSFAGVGIFKLDASGNPVYALPLDHGAGAIAAVGDDVLVAEDPAGASSASIRRVGPTGAVVWKKTFPVDNVVGARLGVGPAGEFYLTTHLYSASGSYDVGLPAPTEAGRYLLMKFDPTGAPLWTHRIGGKGGAFSSGVAVESTTGSPIALVQGDTDPLAVKRTSAGDPGTAWSFTKPIGLTDIVLGPSNELFLIGTEDSAPTAYTDVVLLEMPPMP